MNREILNFLRNIGVDIRFISLLDGFIFINNLKFSRFSRKKEEIFMSKFPQWKVTRSKIFQMMCIRASRVLSKSLKPREKIFINKSNDCASLALHVILEPYTRKYGVEIIYDESLVSAENHEVDSIASPLTLDREVENMINQMFHGKKIQPTSLKTEYDNRRVIYPLINIPDSWIESWAQKHDLACEAFPGSRISGDMLKFLEEYIPNVRENMLKSALFTNDKL